MKVISLFSGIGAFEKALTNLGIEFELVGFSEIDKFAVKSYCAIHGVDESLNLGDITKIDIESLPQDISLITHGSPCQDFSIAGKQAGGDIGTETRSSLMWNTVEIVKHCRPKYVIWENVKNLLSAKHRHNFDSYLEIMKELGYDNYYKVLNAKDYGIPQNRERVYTISIKKDIVIDSSVKESVAKNIRREKEEILNRNKDIYHMKCESGMQDNQIGLKLSPTIRAQNNCTYVLERRIFEFPEKQELKLRLKDILEDNVDEKYYLSDETIEKLNNYKYEQNSRVNNQEGICNTLTTMTGGHREPKVINPIKNKTEYGWHFEQQVFDANGITRCVKAGGGSGNISKIIKYDVPQTVKVRKYEVDVEQLKIILRHHKNKSNKEISDMLNVPITTVEHWFRTDNSFAIPDAEIWLQLKELLNIPVDCFDKSIMEFEERDGVYEKANRVYDNNGLAPTLTQQEEKVLNNYRIRKLTPKECWRLMGFYDEDFEKASKVNSNSQLYKQSGNSIVVNVLEEIFTNLFRGE